MAAPPVASSPAAPVRTVPECRSAALTGVNRPRCTGVHASPRFAVGLTPCAVPPGPGHRARLTLRWRVTTLGTVTAQTVAGGSGGLGGSCRAQSKRILRGSPKLGM